eukprot:CAMPEP_0196665610 /NCGR_PEP_ID=MMETSP1086-20130531/61830_1 /TAXON_ID=77921 /ORGANISM="Cyanoptyche  gloeocystis , Strain SAG4.97" /LENGTH=259 /DNA_ID=CAMNT_0042002463 /DNA_START=272 /DNA_END=1051 /DNA_ORIENTATION=-
MVPSRQVSQPPAKKAWDYPDYNEEEMEDFLADFRHFLDRYEQEEFEEGFWDEDIDLDAELAALETEEETKPSMSTMSSASLEFLNERGETPVQQLALSLGTAALEAQSFLQSPQASPSPTTAAFFSSSFFRRLRDAAPQHLLSSAMSRAESFEQAVLLLSLSLPSLNLALDTFAHHRAPWSAALLLSASLYLLGGPVARLYGFASARWCEGQGEGGWLGLAQFWRNVGMLREALEEAKQIIERRRDGHLVGAQPIVVGQ